MKKILNYCEFVPLYVLIKLLGFLPLSFSRGVTVFLIKVFYLFDKRHRDIAMKNLEIALPELNSSERGRIIKKCYRNLGLIIAEFSRFPRINRDNVDKYVVYKGLENLQDELKKGKGVIVATAHIGNWELSGYAHSAYGGKMHIVARGLKNSLLNDFVNRMRCRYGNSVIEKKFAGFDIIRAIKKNGVVGILMDQNASLKEGAVFVDFFTKKAATTATIARIALKYDIPVIPGYLIMNESYPHTIVFEKPVELSRTGNIDKDVIEITQRVSKIIENVIRKYPEQWFWLHRKWKNRPEGEEEIY